jgi:hypothetical protein
MHRTVGLLSLGLGLGMGAVLLGEDAPAGGLLVASALGLTVLGAVLLGWGSGRARDLIPEQPPAGLGTPAPAQLGVRVEQILRLAEDQARDHIRVAEDQARERIRAAEEEAERIVAKAQTRAGQLRD